MSVKVAVIFPSRGLVFSQTADELLKSLQGIPHKIYFSHRKPIPDCFEEPTERALKDKDVTHLWFVEDDMMLPVDILAKLLAVDKAVVTVDYPISKEGRGAVFKDAGGKVLICGTGCTLVKREVFDELKKPYFRTDLRWNIKNMGDHIKLTGSKNTNLDGYGLHDVTFCMSLHRLGIPIHLSDEVLGQRKLQKLGKAGTNNGAHLIKEWRKVKKYHLLKQVQSWPVQPTGDLVEVQTDTGSVMVTESHAETLISKGLAKKPKKSYSVIDYGDVL